MSAPRKVIAAGTKYHFGGFLDTNGYLIGGSNSAPSNGATGNGMYRIVGIKTASPSVPEPEIVQITGDDELLGEFQFESVATRQFTVDLAVFDHTFFVERLLGITLQNIGEIQFGAIDIKDAPEYDMCFIFQGRAKKQDTGLTGKKAWMGYLVPLATAKFLGRVAFEERGAAVFRFSIAPQMASYMPNGVTIASAVFGTDGLRYQTFEADNPVHIMRFNGDGSASALNLDYTPISAAKSALYSRRVLVSGSTTGISSVDTAAKTATPSASLAEGAESVLFYEFAG